MSMKRNAIAAIAGAAALAGTMAVSPLSAKEYVSIGTGPAGITIYQWGAGMADLIKRNMPEIEASAEATKGLVHNHFLMDKGDVEVAVSVSDMSLEAYRAAGKFGEIKPKNILSLMSICPSIMHIFTSADSDIETVHDLKGKRVAIGQPGGVNMIEGERLLSVLGFSVEDDFEKLYRATIGQQTDLLANGQIDAGIWLGIQPLPPVIKLVAQRDIRFIPLPESVRPALMEISPIYYDLALPANSYEGQTEDVPSYAASALLVVRSDVPEELVYDITKLFMTNVDYLKSVHPALGNLRKETVLNGLATPLHPGAVRAYRELGVPGIEDYVKKTAGM